MPGPGCLNVLEVKTGKVVGTYPGAGKHGTIVFRPDGERIALTTPTRVQVWEFSTGAMYRDIGFSTPFSRFREPTWPSPGYILIGGRFLMDLERHTLLWEYRPGANVGRVAATQIIARRLWFLATNEKQRALIPFSVPDAAIRDVISHIQPDQTLVLQPGMEVTLDVQVEGTPQQREQIRDAFAKNLADNGLRLTDDAPVQVVARTDRGEIEQKGYSRFGGLLPHEKVEYGTFQGYISRVTILIDGKVAWQVTSRTSAPDDLRLEGGESVSQALKRHESPDLVFFDRVFLPKYLCVPCDTYTFGATELTPAGPMPAQPTPREEPESPSGPPEVPGRRA